MTRVQKRRFYYVLLLFLGIVTILSLVLFALKQNLSFFYTPTQISNQEAPFNKKVRIGGVVKKGSVHRTDKLDIKFTLTDYVAEFEVEYFGILPDLFREGQGIITIGKFDEDHKFKTEQILAKHDENYMPPELSHITKDKG